MLPVPAVDDVSLLTGLGPPMNLDQPQTYLTHRGQRCCWFGAVLSIAVSTLIPYPQHVPTVLSNFHCILHSLYRNYPKSWIQNHQKKFKSLFNIY